MINFKPNIRAKVKSFKNDLAPIIFYFDIIPVDPFIIPVLPIPMRIDKLINGVPTAIILPDLNKISRLCEKLKLQFDLKRFLSRGIGNLIDYAKLKKRELTYTDLESNHLKTWWDKSKNMLTCIPDLFEASTFVLSEFIKTYDYITTNDFAIYQTDYVKILLEYCTTLIDYFRLKIENNIFKTREGNHINENQLYLEKKEKIYPNIVTVQVYDKASAKYKRMGFVPYLIYDDILDCFYYNKTLLETQKKKAINLKVYEDNLIIKKGHTLWSSKKYMRTTGLNKLDIKHLI